MVEVAVWDPSSEMVIAGGRESGEIGVFRTERKGTYSSDSRPGVEE